MRLVSESRGIQITFPMSSYEINRGIQRAGEEASGKLRGTRSLVNRSRRQIPPNSVNVKSLAGIPGDYRVFNLIRI